MKREKISTIKEDLKAKGEAVDEASISEGLDEQQVSRQPTVWLDECLNMIQKV